MNETPRMTASAARFLGQMRQIVGIGEEGQRHRARQHYGALGALCVEPEIVDDDSDLRPALGRRRRYSKA